MGAGSPLVRDGGCLVHQTQLWPNSSTQLTETPERASLGKGARRFMCVGENGVGKKNNR